MSRGASNDTVEAVEFEPRSVARKSCTGSEPAEMRKPPPCSAADISPGQHAHPLGLFRPQNLAEQTVFKRKQNSRCVVVWTTVVL